MQRRTFLQCTAAALAGSPLLRQPTAGAPRRVGLELYSVRTEMRRDPEATLAAVRAMGYDDVELLWSWKNFDRTREQVKASLDREGLRAPAAHVNPEILRTEWSKSLDDAAYLGHEYLIVPSLPIDTAKPLDSWREWADTFNTAGAAARKAGIWLAFHNEPSHQRPIDGVVPYDLFLERTDPSVVRLQLDCGNMTMGGGDPLQYLKRHTARYGSFHIKDVVADRSRDTELGQGIIDLRAFVAAIPDIDRKPCFVEQEGGPDPLASARRNLAFVRALRG
ncbi:MAG TPA: sugar phosphate isomerase/epimerase family protein [Gemmatimonadales bacterium]|nr:sugar phosphate isomerase/epimerase family protein [Gemmatimonadales bacterium]